LKKPDVTPEFIADLYAAALEPEGLQGLTDLVAVASNAEVAGIWMVENGNIADIAMTAAGRESLGPYMAHYHKLDLWQANARRMPMGRAYLAYEHTAEDKLLRTEFYNDFARPFGIKRPLGAVVQLQPGVVATVSIERLQAKTPFESDDKPSFQRLIPYVKGALQLRLRQRHRVHHSNVYAASLDALAFGVVICNARAQVRFANTAAQSLAKAGEGLVLGGRGKPLGALAPAETRALARLIHDAATGGAGGVMQITGSNGATALLVLVTPLPRQLQSHEGVGHALVSLRSTLDCPAFAKAELEALFSLSPTQAAVALDLYGGKSPEQIATERGVRISTLRTHLAEIFARTGAENQRDLVRLIGLLPPVRRQHL
jgi:DNA-binding CsgD family transcriptional regulator